MNYTEDQSLALRPCGGNAICLPLRPRCGKHPSQIGSDASNFIIMPITQYKWTTIQNVSIALTNCQSICNKTDEMSGVDKDLDFDTLARGMQMLHLI